MPLKYFIKRILAFIPLLFGITLISFFIMNLAPGDPTTMIADPSMSQEDMMQLKKNLGLDKPLIIQYFRWVANALTGDFGYSYIYAQSVTSLILDRLGPTMILSISSLFLILVITLPLGVFSGANKNSFFDDIVTYLTFFGMSVPTFWLGLILILVDPRIKHQQQ